MSSLSTNGDIIKSLILLLNISLEIRLLGHVCFETWESAAVYQQSRNKSCRIYTLNTHVRNVHNKSHSESKIFVLVNNIHLSGTSSAAMQVAFFWTKTPLDCSFISLCQTQGAQFIFAYCQYFVQCIKMQPFVVILQPNEVLMSHLDIRVEKKQNEEV